MTMPGKIFYPNFFQSRGNIPLGMHGYLPDVDDNKGILIIHSKNNIIENYQDIDAKDMFKLTMQLSKFIDGEIIINTDKSQRISAIIKSLCEKIIEILVYHLDNIETVVLFGSFARNEGNIEVKDNEVIILNDFDLLVFHNGTIDDKIDINLILSKEFAFTIDLCFIQTNVDFFTSSQYLFDLKFGSKVIYGNPLTLNQIKDFSPIVISNFHGTIQFLNRICGILSLIHKDHSDTNYYNYQFVKLALSIFDIFLIDINDYSSSYRTRKNRVLRLTHVFNFSINTVQTIKKLYDIKINLINIEEINKKDLNVILFKIIPIVYSLVFKESFNLNNVLNIIQDIPKDSFLNGSHDKSYQINIYKANFNIFFNLFYTKSKFIGTLRILKLLNLNRKNVLKPNEILKYSTKEWHKITH